MNGNTMFSERESSIFSRNARQKINAEEYYTVKITQKGNRGIKLLIALFVFLIVATLFQYLVLPKIMRVFDTPVAHADEKTVIHQNDYYCAHLDAYVNGQENQFTSYCASLKK